MYFRSPFSCFSRRLASVASRTVFSLQSSQRCIVVWHDSCDISNDLYACAWSTSIIIICVVIRCHPVLTIKQKPSIFDRAQKTPSFARRPIIVRRHLSRIMGECNCGNVESAPSHRLPVVCRCTVAAVFLVSLQLTNLMTAVTCATGLTTPESVVDLTELRRNIVRGLKLEKLPDMAVVRFNILLLWSLTISINRRVCRGDGFSTKS